MLRALSRSRALRGFYRIWWERAYGVSPKDVFLVSSPRSGNTWVRFMLLQARPDFQEDDFRHIEEIIPDMHGAKPWFRCGRANIVKSHLTYWQPFRRVVYLVRDGRAATLSNWKYQRDEGTFNGEFMDFLNEGHWPSSWGKHVSGWESAAETKLVVRYEDLIESPDKELGKIASILGWSISTDHAKRIAANSTKERMRDLEWNKKIKLHRVGSSKFSFKNFYTSEMERSFIKSMPKSARKYLDSSFEL